MLLLHDNITANAHDVNNPGKFVTIFRECVWFCQESERDEMMFLGRF